ncbi:MAG: hypothetical protein AAF738_11150, partial [Bacteroidota bacterium]
MLIRLVLFVCLFPLLSTGFAQGDLALGQWKSYLPYQESVSVAQSADRIFYATPFGLLALDKADFAVEYFSKVKGLSNVGIQLIDYNPYSEVLMVVYQNGVIDLLKPTGTVVLNQIRNFRNILGEKTVNNVFVANDSITYLAANYGLSRLNTVREEFEFTTFTGTAVEDVAVYANKIYAATSEGIYRIDVDDPLPDNFENWEALRNDFNFPDDYGSQVLALFEEQLFLNVDEAIYAFDGSTLDTIYQEAGYEAAYLSSEGAGLVIGLTRGTQQQGKVLYLNAAKDITPLASDCTFNPYFAIEDQNQDQAGFIWFADQARGFKYLENLSDNSCKSLSFDSPYSQYAY